jgi:hypothetical protein
MSLPRPLLFLALLTSLLSGLARAQGGTGMIEGRVFNAATGTALANARVGIEGGERFVLTDDSGSYRLAAVPAGVMPRWLTVTLMVPAGTAARR